MTKTRILFVDDDPDVLKGLGRLLHKQRGRWEIVFVLGARAGLEEIERTTFDVVVSDMRMPDFDGVELLARARDRDPTTIRMVLSGFHERRPISHTAPVVHHFLDKPCFANSLTMAMERACAVRARFASEPLQALLADIAALPSGVMDAVVSRIFEQDAALSDRIYARARAASFASMTSIADAISRFGLELIASFAFEPTASDPDTVSDVTGGTAIRDISMAMIAIAMPQHELMIARRLDEGGATRSSLEREIIGTTHIELAANLLTRWGLPLETIETLAQPEDDTSPVMHVSSSAQSMHP